MAAEIASTSFLSDTLVILGAAGIVIPVFARFRITPVIGFILVGLLVGPSGLGSQVASHPWLGYLTITDPHRLEPFAEFGIILLLFSVGLELSFGRLWAMRRQLFMTGALELAGAALLIALGLIALGNSLTTALALGLALALSSTALVLRITDTASPVGKAALAMLLFEDLALVPIIFLLGAMGRGGEAQSADALLRTLMLGGVVVAALLVAGRFVLPLLFAQAARTKSPELFLAASLIAVIVSALATAATGLSPIVGALIAGLLIAETEYHTEVETITAPFKGLALGVFLLTIGMGIDLSLVWKQAGAIAIAVMLVLTAKALVTGLMLRASGARTGTAVETGILLASPSETTLIVLTAALGARLINAEAAQFWQIVTAIGLTVTPILSTIGRWLGQRVDRQAIRNAPIPDDEQRALIVGFGRVGQLIADMLREHGKPFLAIDSDADVIAAALRKGYPVAYADAARAGSLSRFGIDKATAVILTMDEPHGVQRMVRRLHAEHPALPIIARARSASHAAQLYKAGASIAVPDALEGALQLSEAALANLGVPMGFVIASIHEKRDEFRQRIMDEGNLAEKPKLKTATLRDKAAELRTNTEQS